MGKDHLIRAISANGYVNICAADCRETVEKARQLHGCSPTAAAALGRTLIVTSMMGTDIKNENGSVTVKINGGGELGSILCVSDSHGMVRGYVEDPFFDPPRKSNGKLDVGAGVGNDGYIQVIKDIGMREPYTGRVPLISGEIAEDITSYFFISEQTPTVCGLGVLIDTDYSVKAAGGFLIRLLPGAPDEVISEVEACAPLFGSVTELLEQGVRPEDMPELLLPGLDMRLLPDSRTEVGYECKCSRDRISKALISLGKKELISFAEDHREKDAEVTCQFCDAIYRYSCNDIMSLYKEATKE